MRRFALLSVLIISMTALAQDTPQKFHFTIKNANVTGTDEFTITKTANGFHVAGTATVNSPGRQSVLTHSQDLDSSWTLQEYRLTAKLGNDPQHPNVQDLDVLHKGNAVTLTLDSNGQLVPKELAWKPNTIVLDNFITAHYQVLLNAIAAAGPTLPAEWHVLVPQRMTAVTAKLEAKPDPGSGTLNGQPVTTKIYSLEIGASLIEITADQNNQLMRMQVPLQQFDAVRDGFVPAPEKPSPFPAACIDSPADFPSGTLKVPATLCTPKDLKPGAKFPIVVLVHGSGPHDRDETIGPNKPFKDIAEGLAAAGIGSLRYDKRTFFAPKDITTNSTVEDEVITDAVAAMNAAAKEPGADPARVYLLGHSLGGMLAPYIAQRAPDTHGVILMAAAAVPLDQTIERQLAKQMKATGASQADIDKRIEQVKQQFAQIREGKLTGSVTVFGAPAHYWADLLHRDIPAEMKKIDVPVLAIQAGKDIQITNEDFDLIKTALAGKRAEFKVFPNLNHLMMPVEGASTGAEYGKPGHVDPEVVKAITDWIAGN
ncbi:MAG: alpha/beta fold hydrolase [Terriglobia bacterium]|nr:alpha/beta fold hydrolase [Terriglobia bacterium]